MAKDKILALAVASAATVVFADEPRTFCNPMPIPDMPVGIMVRGCTNGTPLPAKGWTRDFWKRCSAKLPTMQQFRELADPAVLVEGGTWYLYPSCAQMWVSENCGGSWRHVPTFDVGPYAPAIAKFRGKYYLTSSGGPLYVADKPTGPFVKLGKFDLKSFGKTLDPQMPSTGDAALLADGDHLYLYWGVYNFPKALWGVELDPDDPVRAKVPNSAKCLMTYDEKKYPWLDELVEGSWVIKRNGVYYLCYATGNTCRTHYVWCASKSLSPLGPFVPQKRNPFFETTEGLVTGTSHGSVYQDERGDWWINHCVTHAAYHGFERFIAQDRLYFDEDGDISFGSATSTPQWLPSSGKTGDTGWKALKLGDGPKVAVDGCLATWEKLPAYPATLTYSLDEPTDLRACRLIWRDLGYDHDAGVNGGPYKYRVEARVGGTWKTWIDRSESAVDLTVDYREGPDLRADAVRLVVLGGPKGITPAVVEFTVFGEPDWTHPEKLYQAEVPAGAEKRPVPAFVVFGEEAKKDLSAVVKAGYAVLKVPELADAASQKARIRLIGKALRADERIDMWLLAFVGSALTVEEQHELHQHPAMNLKKEFVKLADWPARLAFLDAHGWRNYALPKGTKVVPPGDPAADRAFFVRNVYGRRPVERPEGLTFKQVGEDGDVCGSIGRKRTFEISWPGKYRPGSFRVTVCTPRNAKGRAPALVQIGFKDPEYELLHRERWYVEELLLKGFATASFCYTDVAPDPGGYKPHDDFSSGVYPCFERPQDRTAESWGAISAWAWAASRVADLLETLEEIDPAKLGVVGLSRLGKTALWTGATDARFALVCATGSGCEGAAMNAIVLPGEDAVRIYERFPYWFCGNYRKTMDGGLAAGYDQHRMMALIAPRALYVSDSLHDTPRYGDFEGLRHASPAWEAMGLGSFANETFPERLETPIWNGRLAFHLRHGFHGLTRYDWLAYMDFARRQLGW